ncbi:sigma-54-dependent Fis family transcriptional regulator [Bacillus sp. H-16]|uniref:sigma-54-dependent transcriptional regulator n=1 Tax=Alteribacter salitolerans TaxID=2912333 RepID=UPI001964681D|nr:sigma-54 dependent transcriptional regulator [Alteribacter salitolerans]MBM7095770.1 sigma-54-dependent Fis family transcriptional regulator [Alteribacter salitolerans]
MKKVMIIDDEPSICSSLAFALEDTYDVVTTTDPEKGLAMIAEDHFDLCLLDLRIGNVDGLDVLKQIKQTRPSVIVIMVTAYGTISSSVEAVKEGAFSYITKPVNMDELFTAIEQAFHYRELSDQVEYLSQELEKKYRYEGLIGKSEAMQHVFRMIEKVKKVDTNVLITGESGTGKELVARAIHFAGKRKKEHFEVVNCAAIPDQLLESELFGYEKGAYTGAVTAKEGKFQLADKGTIFLDEIGDMPFNLQAKLLRVLQDKKVTRLGSNKPEKIDVRVIAATNKSFEEVIQNGEFREDLYFRLNVLQIPLPPLRERKDDLPSLMDHFIRLFNKELGKDIKGFTKEAKKVLLNHDYPGNIREFSNIIESSMVLADGGMIELSDLPPGIKQGLTIPSEDSGTLEKYVGLTLKELETKFIMATLEHNEGHRKNTAKMLGISERSLRDKVKALEE